MIGKHGRLLHEERVKDVEVEALQADERHGFSDTKVQPAWEAKVMDPQSKLVLAHEQGRRDETLIRRLYEDVVKRVSNRHNLVLFTDGEHSYASLFPEYFGVAYRPSRNGAAGRRPNIRYPETPTHTCLSSGSPEIISYDYPSPAIYKKLFINGRVKPPIIWKETIGGHLQFHG